MSAPVTLTGRLVRDPELKTTSNGKVLAKFTVVTNDRVRNRDTQEWEDSNTTFWDVTAFDQLAENIGEQFRQGSLVVITGKVRQENWEKDGQKRSALRVQANDAGLSLKFSQSRSSAKRVAAVSEDERVPF
jgi:single-strand DNA-binding protein